MTNALIDEIAASCAEFIGRRHVARKKCEPEPSWSEWRAERSNLPVERVDETQIWRKIPGTEVYGWRDF